MRLAVAFAVVLGILAPAVAQAGPGGKLAGTVAASWSGEGSTGQLGVALDPGNAARDAAVARIRSVQHFRTGDPFSSQAAHVTQMTSQTTSTFACADVTSTRTTTCGAIIDGSALLHNDHPLLDLLHKNVPTHLEPVLAN